MGRRSRDKRARNQEPRDADTRAEQRFIAALRQFQLASAGVMLVGVTTATLVCAGEFRQPWLIAAGAVLFVLGLALYGLSRPLARRWTSRR